MFLSKTAIQIPAKTVIQDLISRNGSPTAESLSPFNGMQPWLVRKKINFDGNMELLFSKQTDFNPDKKQPKDMVYTQDEDNINLDRTVEYNIETHPACDYLRRMEDIDASWVRAYMENVLYGIQNNKTGGVKEYNQQHQNTYTFEDDEDGTTEEKDLLTDELDHPVADMEQAKKEIPYLLKRILEESKEIGISLMSMLIAYEKSKSELSVEFKYSGNPQTPKPRHLLDKGIYEMDKYGNVGAKLGLDANKNNRSFGVAKDWLFSDQPTRSDASALVFAFYVLGIDIKEEDPRIFDENYISKMTATFISGNQSYVARKHGKELGLAGGFMKSVYDDLGNMPLEYYEATARVDQIDEEDYLTNAAKIFNMRPIGVDDYDDTDTDIGPDAVKENEENLSVFFQYYDMLYGTSYAKMPLRRYDGFLVDRYYCLISMDVSKIFTEPKKQTVVTYHTMQAIVHINGYLILAAPGVSTYRLEINKAKEYVAAVLNGDDINFKWEVISL